MVAPCVLLRGRPDLEVEPLNDVNEFHDFVRRMGMHFWNPAMLGFGHAFGIRSSTGRLVCAAGVNFVLSEESYAQVGPVVTDPRHRGRSLASRLLARLFSSLAEVGIRQCGVFAREDDANVVHFYERRGFIRKGQFRLMNMMGLNS